MRTRQHLLALVAVALIPCPSNAQGEPGVHQGKPWEAVEAEREEIEEAIIGGDLAGGFVTATSALYEHRLTPSFSDIAMSIHRAFLGIPLHQALEYSDFLQTQLSGSGDGLAWFYAGLAARAIEDEERAAQAFAKALEDPDCCRIPLTYTYLGASQLWAGEIHAASEAFEAAVHAASQHATIRFQVRHAFAEEFRKSGNVVLYREAVAQSSLSEDLLERAWGKQQLAQLAWYDGDSENFTSLIPLALADHQTFNASTEWSSRWEEERWAALEALLESAQAAIQGATDGRLALDYESAILDAYIGDVTSAYDRMVPYLPQYPLSEIDSWEGQKQVWGQRLHVIANNLLARLGRYEEAIAGYEAMIRFTRNTDSIRFVPHVHCHLGYACLLADRLEDARAAYETGLSLLDVPGEVTDPAVMYIRNGEISENARMMFVANYRWLLREIEQRERMQ